MPRKSNASYTVGYGRPPAHTRFRPGQSGNPRGRPRKAASPALDLPPGLDPLSEATLRILAEEVSVCIDGHIRCASSEEAILLVQRARALDGDLRSARFLQEKRLEAQEKAAQTKARSANSKSLSRAVVAFAEAMRTAKALGYESVEAYLDQLSGSATRAAVNPPASPPAEPSRDDDEPFVEASGEGEGAEEPSPEITPQHDAYDDYEDLPPSDRSEDRGEARVEPDPCPSVDPQLRSAAVSRSGPLIQPRGTLSGCGYGIGGGFSRHPVRGIFK